MTRAALGSLPAPLLRRRGWSGRLLRNLLRLRKIGLYGVLLAFTPVIGTAALVACEAKYAWSDHLAGGGFVAALIILALGGLTAGLALVVTHVVALVCGWALGFWLGLPVALSVFTLAACLNYAIGRTLAGEEMMRFIQRHRKLRRLHQLFLTEGKQQEITLVFLLRVSPVLPFTSTNIILASAGVPLLPYAIGTFLGKAPQGAAVVFIGANMQNLSLDRPDEAWLTWLVAGLTVCAVIGASWLGRRALKRLDSPL